MASLYTAIWTTTLATALYLIYGNYTRITKRSDRIIYIGALLVGLAASERGMLWHYSCPYFGKDDLWFLPASLVRDNNCMYSVVTVLMGFPCFLWANGKRPYVHGVQDSR